MGAMRRSAACLGAAAMLTALAACSTDPAGTVAPGNDGGTTSTVAPVDQGGTAEMQALCARMVAGGMSPDEATDLATENGYVTRIGTLEGEPQALTMDFREDRFTFEVTGGVVVDCTYG